jgi:PAS domain S-box-containing protein
MPEKSSDNMLEGIAAETCGRTGLSFLEGICAALHKTTGFSLIRIISLNSFNTEKAMPLCGFYRDRPMQGTGFDIRGTVEEKTLHEGFLCIPDGLDALFSLRGLPKGFKPRCYIGVATPGSGQNDAGVIGLFSEKPADAGHELTESRLKLIAHAAAQDIILQGGLIRSQEILNVVSDYMLVLNTQGTVIMSNEFQEKPLPGKHGHGILNAIMGDNYLQILKKAAAAGDETLGMLYNAIRNILDGSGDFFSADITIDDPVRTRYYSATITRLHNKQAAVITFSEITEQVHAGKLLSQSEERNRSLVEGIPDTISRQDGSGRILEVIPGMGMKPVRPVEELSGKTLREILPPETAALLEAEIEAVVSSGKNRIVEYTLPGENSLQHLESRIVHVNRNEVLAFTRDITERKRTEYMLSQLATVVEQASESVLITDMEGNMEYVNPCFVRTTGYSFNEAIGQNPRILKSGMQKDDVYREMWETISSGRVWNGVFINKNRDGSLIHEETSIFPIRDSSGNMIKYAAVKRNITDRIAAEGIIREQNLFLNTVIESMSNPFFVIDAGDYSILMANSAARGMTEASCYSCRYLSGLTKKPCTARDHPCPISMVETDLKPVNVEQMSYDRDGHQIFHGVHCYPVFNKEGKLAQMILYSHDITDRKTAEMELRKLSMAVEQSFNTVMITDRNLLIEYVNPAFSRITGYSAREVLGRRPFELQMYDNDIIMQYWDSINKTGMFIGEIPATRKDGTQYWEYASITGIKNDEGEVTHYVKDGLDITSRKHSEAMLAEAKKNAERANRAKSDFLANMSHEIRTPMNSIIGFLKMLESGDLNRSQKEYINYVQISAETLLRIINDILDFSKLESNKLTIDIHSFDPMEEFEKEVEVFQSMAIGNNVHLLSHIDPRLPAEIMGDSFRIRQVLNNFISNSIKFTPEGGDIVVNIELSRRDGKSCSILFSVSDTGIGIPEHEKKNIFKSFYQTDTSTTRKYGGTGLGLAISQSLIFLMGGRIDFTSVENLGSRFFFELNFDIRRERQYPERLNISGREIILLSQTEVLSLQELMIVNYLHFVDSSFSICHCGEDIPSSGHKRIYIFVYETAIRRRLDSILERLGDDRIIIITSYNHYDSISDIDFGTGSIIIEPFTMRKLLEAIHEIAGGSAGVKRQTYSVPPPGRRYTGQALIAEDNELNQKLISLLLEERGIDVDIASNGQEAVDSFRKKAYDIIFMDINMPVKDGVEALRDIRLIESETGKSRQPVIALTAKAIKGDSEHLLKQGFDGYLSKPIDIAEFDRIISEKLKTGSDNVKTVSGKKPYRKPDTMEKTDRYSLHVESAAAALGLSSAVVAELIDDFITGSDSHIAAIEKAVSSGNRADMAAMAHKFKGIAANLRFTTLSGYLKAIEENARENRDTDYTNLLCQIKDEMLGIRTMRTKGE